MRWPEGTWRARWKNGHPRPLHVRSQRRYIRAHRQAIGGLYHARSTAKRATTKQESGRHAERTYKATV